MYFVNVGTNEYLKTTNLYNGGDSDDGDGSNTEFLLANFNVNHDCTTKLQIGYVGANDGWMYWLNDDDKSSWTQDQSVASYYQLIEVSPTE